MIDEIKKNLKTEKLVFGKNQTIKKIQSGEVVKIFLASNCKAEDCNDLEHYCSFNKIPIESVSANPLMKLVLNQNKIAAAIRVVKFPSRIEVQARLNP